VVLLLLGLPIIDILVVASKRVRSRLNLFQATRNHIHHRLLDLGFIHQESVIIIYSLQMVFVTSGVLLRYESNELITIVYFALCASVFIVLNLAERSGWHLSGRQKGIDQNKVMAHDILRKTLVVIPRRFLSIGIPVYLVGTALTIEHVPSDFAKLALLISGLMVLELFFGSGPHSVMRRALIYVTAAFVVYLGISYRFEWAAFIEPVNTTFYALTAIAFAAAVKFSPRRRKAEFSTTATDYLVVLCLMAVLVASKGDLWNFLLPKNVLDGAA
jgi:UDP-GlcNAc:undecaprenyl-phosphate GlcNAc-1-phosphate transferase